MAATSSRQVDLLLLPILALDSNLDKYYHEYIAGIAEATRQDTRIMALVLADRSDPSDPDTRILKIQCGGVERLTGLPSLDLPATDLDPTLREYDMTDPRQLAAFIKWARTTRSGERPAGDPNAVKTVVSYVAHGLPIVPAIDISRYLTTPVTSSLPAALDVALAGLPPAPTKIPATPDQLTDQTSVTLLSPYSLTHALTLATNNGANPITVLDLVHCFGGTIEELYELSNPGGQPVAEVVVTSPNYTYAGASILTKVLKGLRPEQDARRMAEAVVRAHAQALAEADGLDNDGVLIQHPRIIVGVDLSKVAAIKDQIDLLAQAVIDRFDEDREGTKGLLLEAHRSAIHYDTMPTAYEADDDPTASCPHDYRLTEHDGLSDLTSFVGGLQTQFPPKSVSHAAAPLSGLVESAVITRTQEPGVPWFAHNPALERWDFAGASGIALYTDFHGQRLGESTYIGWQAHWYTRTISDDNLHPFQFVQGTTTWADVLQTYWADRLGSDAVKTMACVTQLPQAYREPLLLYLPLIQQ
jgi:hypothetical protein